MLNLKIGIFTFRQYPYVSANVAIGVTLAEQLRDNHGAEVISIAIKQDEKQDEVNEFKNIPIRFLNDKIKNPGRIENKMQAILGQKAFLHNEAKALKRIVIEEKIDMLVSVIAPIQVAYITELAKLDIPWYIYQLDPFYNVGDIENQKLKEDFISIMNKTNHLFTTDLLYDIYKQDEKIKPFIDKMSIVEFPKLEDRTVTAVTEDKDKDSVLLYSGSLYKKIRNPKILLELKNSLPDECIVRFLGACDDKADDKMLKEGGLDCWGYSKPQTVEEQLNNADFLINIGNTVRNQLGSKLIEYISTGKPIINIYQYDNCVTSKVLDKYKYKFDVSSKDLCKPEIKEQLKEFVLNLAGKTESYEEILKDYYDYTPECVGNIFAKTMNI